MTSLAVVWSKGRALATIVLLSVAAVVSLAFLHVSHDTASATCSSNATYFTGQTPNIWWNGAKVKGMVHLKGIIVPGSPPNPVNDPYNDPLSPGDFIPSRLHGTVNTKTIHHTLTQISWQAWLEENDQEVDNFGSSCLGCTYGSSVESYHLTFNKGLGVFSLHIRGSHVFHEQGSDPAYLFMNSSTWTGPL